MKTILYTWFAVLLFGMAAVSCGDDDTKNNDTTGITGSSWKASETVGADRTTKKYTFKASANWVAQSDKPEWCKILTSSGDKGSDRQLNITVEANETGSTRSANITVQVSGYARAAQFAITQLGSSSGGTGADTELNKQVDKILEYYYLWNGEYRQMSRDLSLDYISSSDNFLKRTLLEMTTNDLDKKRQSNGSYSVYSYLLRTPLTKAVDGTKPEVNHGVAKKKEYGFGIAGLMGAGRTELAMSIFGRSYGKNISGTALLNGKEVDISTVEKAIRNKIAYVTEDRKGYGLILENEIQHNVTMANLEGVSSKGVINQGQEFAVASEYKKKINIRCPSVFQLVGNLSGGNQQKVVLSKWLFAGPDVLILDEPTRGIDVGAKYEIYCLIEQLAKEGKCIIMISSEMPELLGMTDRLYVMNEGAFIAEMKTSDASQEKIMRAIVTAGKG
mgnify:CR=1 FL=1